MSDMAICTKCAALSRELSEANDVLFVLNAQGLQTPRAKRDIKRAKSKALRAERRYMNHIVEKHQLTIPF